MGAKVDMDNKELEDREYQNPTQVADPQISKLIEFFWAPGHVNFLKSE